MILRIVVLFFFLCIAVHKSAAQDSLCVAYVKTMDDRWQVIDHAGTVLADSLFEHESLAILTCTQGMAVTERAGKYGYRSLFGGALIPNQYCTVTGFRENGIAAVQSGDEWRLMTLNGTLLAGNLSFEDVQPFLQNASKSAASNDGYCLVETDSSINCTAPNGLLVLAGSDPFIAPWNDVTSFIQDRILKYQVMTNKICSCQKLNNYYGFVDHSGNWVIEPLFEEADIFSQGLAAVAAGTEGMLAYGYISMDGDWHVPPIYTAAGWFTIIQRSGQ